MKRADESTFHTLDGIRGFGALLVCYQHTFLFWGGAFGGLVLNPLCVDIFFVLSGCVLAFVYEPRFAQGKGVGWFMRQRFVRLYPIYFIGFLMGGAVHLLFMLNDSDPQWRNFAGDVLTQFLMLPQPPEGAGSMLYPFNGPAWTLFFELCINLVYVLIWPWLTTRKLIALVVACAAALAAIGLLLGRVDVGLTWGYIAGGFVRASLGFFAGVLIYRLNGSTATAARPRSLWALMTIVILVLIGSIPQPPEFEGFLTIALIYAGMFFLINLGQAVQPPRWAQQVFARLGAISFAVYMVHFPLYDLAVRLDWMAEGGLRAAGPWSGLWLMAASVSLAYLIDRYYDAPARKWLDGALRWMEREINARRRPEARRAG